MRRLALSVSVAVAFCIFCLICLDALLHLTHYDALVPTSTAAKGYFMVGGPTGVDIAPNYPKTHMDLFDSPFDIWSNSLGCFDTPFDEEHDIPFVYLAGDSYTWGYASFEDKWGTLMEKILHTRILKCGVPGTGTAQELAKAEQTLDRIQRTPELIVLGYTATDPFDDMNPHSQSSCGTISQPCWPLVTFLSGHSVLYNMNRALFGSFLDSTFRPMADDLYGPNFKALSSFAKLAHLRHSQFLVVLIPSKKSIEAKNKDLAFLKQRHFLRNAHIPFMDLTEEFRNFYSETGVPLYWKHDPHLNILGNEMTALLVSKYIVEHHLLAQKNSY